jgi:hypothetical protein
MKRVAIPVTNNLLSEFFGTCSHYEIFEIEKKVLNKYQLLIPDRIDITELPAWLEKMGITDVVSFRVNPKIMKLFASKKVNLFVGIPFNTPDAIIDDYLKGRLESNGKIIAEITSDENNREI